MQIAKADWHSKDREMERLIKKERKRDSEREREGKREREEISNKNIDIQSYTDIKYELV